MNNNIAASPIFQLSPDHFLHISKFLDPQCIRNLSMTCTQFANTDNNFLQNILAFNEKALYVFSKNFDNLNQFQKQAVERAFKILDFSWREGYLLREKQYERLESLQNVAKVVLHIPTIFNTYSLGDQFNLFVFVDEASFFDAFIQNRRLTVKNTIANRVTFLHFAAMKGAIEICRLLIEKYKLDINAQDQEGSTPLLLACRNSPKLALELIKWGADINKENNKKISPLYAACTFGHEELIMALLGKNAEFKHVPQYIPLILHCCKHRYFAIADLILERGVDAHGKNLDAALFCAAERGQDDAILYLVKKGANLFLEKVLSINKVVTPLTYILENGNFKLIDKLLESSILEDIDHGDPDHGNTLLHIATEANNMDAIKKLVEEYEACVVMPNSEGTTPLHIATRNANCAIVDYLLENDAEERMYSKDDAEEDETGIPWLDVFQRDKHVLELARIFIKHGVDVNFQEDEGKMTALFLAGGCPDIAVVKLLIEKGALINTVNSFGETPLMEAIRYDAEENVICLLENGAQTHHRDKHTHETALHLAVGSGNLTLVRLLVDHNAEVNAQDVNGITPLFLAVKRRVFSPNYLEIATFLLSKGALFNVRDKETSDTPLHSAVAEHDLDMVRLLVENNADINAQNNSGNTPLLIAISKDSIEIALYLLEKGANGNLPNLRGISPLEIALTKDNPMLVDAILTKA